MEWQEIWRDIKLAFIIVLVTIGVVGAHTAVVASYEAQLLRMDRVIELQNAQLVGYQDMLKERGLPFPPLPATQASRASAKRSD